MTSTSLQQICLHSSQEAATAKWRRFHFGLTDRQLKKYNACTVYYIPNEIQGASQYLMGCVNSATEYASPVGPASTLKGKKTQETHTLRVATLNYSGIMRSPFQFYSGQFLAVLTSISAVFQELTPRYIPEVKSDYVWACASLDKRLKEARYCPLYTCGVGIEDGRFLTEQEFREKWRAVLSQAIRAKELTFSETEIDNALLFDLIAYHALLRHVYGVETIDEAQELSPRAYLEEFTPLFQQSFLDMGKKVNKCESYLKQHTPHILFIQQASRELIDMLQKQSDYQVETGPESDCLILVKKDKLGTLVPKEQVLSQEECRELDWQGRTAIMTVGKYVLLSGHLSSKKATNATNVTQMKKSLQQICTAHPDYQVICGADVNSYLEKWEEGLQVYPGDDTQPTSLKKRTHAQVQRKKAEVVSGDSKDSIISTLPILEGQIRTIEGNWPETSTFLPLDKHPFDHFLVAAQLQLFHGQ